MPRTGSIASNVGPGGQQHALAGEQLRLRATRSTAAKISSGSSMRPSPVSPQAWSPLSGPRIATPSAASCATLRWLAALRPHLPVHRRRDEQRAVAREAQRRQQIVGVAVRELGEEVGGGRRDDDRVGAARELDVAHAVVGAAMAHRSVSTGRPDSACSVIGVTKRQAAAVITTSTRDARLDEEARELGGLVRGDAAGEAEHDAGERNGRGGHRPVGGWFG